MQIANSYSTATISTGGTISNTYFTTSNIRKKVDTSEFIRTIEESDNFSSDEHEMLKRLAELFKNDSVLLKGFCTALRKQEPLTSFFERALKRSKTNKDLKELYKEFNHSDEDPNDLDTIIKKKGIKMPQHMITVSKTDLIEMFESEALILANTILESYHGEDNYAEYESFQDYDKNDINVALDNMKPKYVKAAVATAETLSRMIAYFNVRVNNTAHQMLSYLGEHY